jgi:bifunctional UDP-N-acetylglucosamine pyrophosphorylase / glucosamine-1-phosphate N-acetyltransferase
VKKLAVVILAAGEGTRMKSSLPKVLHKLAGRPLIKWVMSSVYQLKPQKVVLVVGHEAGRVKKELAGEKVLYAEQKKQFGSGHALHQAARQLKNFKGDILVLCGDAPLIKRDTLRKLVDTHRMNGNAVTVLSSCAPDPFGYGRIVRGAAGEFTAIIEQKDADENEKKINEINSGTYCFSSPMVWKALSRIKPDNNKKEYYLTDAVGILSEMGGSVEAAAEAGFDETLGINTRTELAYAEGVVRQKILAEWMARGVTIIDPANTYISLEASIGRDTVIKPGTVIEGATEIGGNCVLGPWTFISESSIGSGVEIRSSYVYSSLLGDNAKVGPFSHLRPGTKLKAGSRVGNFSEVKNSVIGFGSKVSHLSYIGDAFLGEGVNIGAGTITCNYDGYKKNKTYIGDRSFIGSNTNLVAPVKVGADSLIGAGSTITKNVPSGSLAIARAHQITKKNYKK